MNSKTDKEYKFQLQKYSGPGSRHTCPKCGRKHCFTYYVDQDGNEIDEIVGRCNHESSCGYHYPPHDYFNDNAIEYYKPRSDSYSITKDPKNKRSNTKSFTPSYIDAELVIKNKSQQSTFVDFLKNLIKNQDIVRHLCETYQLGATYKREVIFWQIDKNFRVRGGKIMVYDLRTGKRVKDDKYGINWVHSKWKGKTGIPADFNLKQCLFGEHLLRLWPFKPVAVVESEKTAIIAYSLFPDFIWVATGGKSNTDILKMKVLQGRSVVLFPDVDGFEKWSENAKTYSFCDATVCDALEKYASDKDRELKIDIADVFIQLYHTITKEMT